jgi:hypothetical protein
VVLARRVGPVDSSILRARFRADGLDPGQPALYRRFFARCGRRNQPRAGANAALSFVVRCESQFNELIANDPEEV